MLGKLKYIFNDYFWRIAFQVGNDLKFVGAEPSLTFEDAKDQLTGFVAEKMRQLNNTKLDGFCYRLDHTSIIEPSLSYAIVGINKIMRASITFTNLKPSTAKYLKYRIFRTGKSVRVNSAVLFDGKLGDNYYHFFADVFNKLWLLDYYNIDKSTPLIISKSTFESSYFKYLHNDPRVNCYNWLVQGDQDFITCKTLFFIKPAPWNKPLWDRTLSVIEKSKNNGEPYRRLFINRPEDKPRGLRNLKDILPILKQNAFEIINPGSLSFDDQVKIFSEAKIIVGLHGAALTNIAFAHHQEVHILEMGPLNGMTGQFYWLSLMLNIKYYNCIFGTGLVNSKFEISPELFEKALSDLLSVE